MAARLRKAIFFFLAVLVLGALLYRARGVINLREFSWDRLAASVRGARASLLLLSISFIYVAYAIRSLRWKRFSNYLPRACFLNIYASTLMGFSTVFLLGRAGEPIRPLLIARKDRVPVSSTFGIYVLERLFDTLSTVILAGLSLLLVPELMPRAAEGSVLARVARSSGIGLLVLLIVAAIALIYLRSRGTDALRERTSKWKARPGWKRRLAGIVEGFAEGVHAIRTWRDLAAATGLSAAHWFLMSLVYLWVAHAFGGRLGEVTLLGAMLVLFFTMIGSAVQLPAVGGGSQVASFLAFTGIFGVEKEPAAAASVVLWLITFAASSLAGIPLLLREGWTMGELRRLARAEAEAEDAGAHAAVPEAPRIHGAKSARSGASE